MAFFHFLDTVLHGDQNPGGGVFGFLRNLEGEAQKVATIPLNTARLGVAEATGNQPAAQSDIQNIHGGISTLRQFGQAIPGGAAAIAAAVQGKKEYQSTSPVLGFLTGNQPITTPYGAYQQARANGHALPFALAAGGLSGALDLPIGPGRFFKGNLVNDLAKAGTREEVTKIMTKGGIAEGIANKIAPEVAFTKDPNIIKNIIQKAHSPAPTINDILPPTPVTVPAEAAGQGANEAINKHLQTLSNSETTSEELKQGLKGLEQTHKERNTEQAFQKANEEINKDFGGNVAKVLAEKPSDKNAFLAQALVQKAQKEGNTELAVNIAEKADQIFREGGRIAQAASITARLSPEGQLLRATRQIRKARETNPDNAQKEITTAQEIKKTFEAAKPILDDKTISGIVKEATTGEKIASKVESAASPAVKKQTDTLVNEITKKVKQEYLLPKTTIKKSPLDIIKEVMGRNEEAQAAYPEAQSILREKFAGDEKMSEALDKFFGSKLGTPVAGTTFTRAISDQLKVNQLKVSNVIKTSIKNQKQSVEDITSALTKEGFDAQSAATIAKEVSTRLENKLTEAKRATLENLGKEVKSRNQPTVMEKINKFSNLGALSNEDYLHLARAKLNLPHLSTETANKIHDLSQKLQDLPEGHDKYAAVREIQHLILSEIPKTKRDLLREFVGLPRTILASGDFSFGGRQALVYATSHPIKFAKAWPKQFEYFKQAFKGKDSEAYDAMMADIRSHPDFPLLEKYIKLQEPTGHDTAFRQEQFVSSDLAEKIPAIGNLVRASNYAYTGLGNYLKANEFYAQLEHLRYGNLPLTEKALTQLGEVIDTSLGRGGKKGGFAEQHSGFLMTAFFSPRLMASRLNVLNPAYYIRLKGPARQEALRGALGLAAFAGGILGLAKLAGADVSTDPRNADFGKIKVGDTRFDALAGFTQYIRFARQLQSGQKINSTTGAQTEAGKGFAGSRLDIASNFLQGKENPSVSFITDMLKGKDINGNSLYNFKGVSTEVKNRFIPLIAQDMADLITHPNSAGPLAGVAGVFGVGLQTYGKQDLPLAPGQKEALKILQSQGATPDQIASYKDFYQTLKAGPPRANTSEDINKALAASDLNKAQQLAQDYNQKVIDNIKTWLQAHQGETIPKKLYDELRSSLIDLTSASIRSRLQSIVDNPDKYHLKIGAP